MMARVQVEFPSMVTLALTSPTVMTRGSALPPCSRTLSGIASSMGPALPAKMFLPSKI